MKGGFSIREYAAQMRSINVVNCWPFDETSTEQTVRTLLPPITVKKFTWWLDELEYTHSKSAENKKKKKKKKKGVEKGGEASSRVDMDTSESEVGVGKPKAPKKRSILEIFAVAPPVVGEGDGGGGRRGRKKKLKNSDVKVLTVIKKIKKNKRQDYVMDQSIPNKENCCKLKLQAQDKVSKDLDHNIWDCEAIFKRKPIVQHLDACKKKSAPCEALKLIEENRHAGSPVRGILKNHGDTFSQKQSRKCILQEAAIPVNPCSSKMANRHVTFSEKDEFLRPSRKPSHSVDYYEFCSSDMSNVDPPSEGVGIESTAMETIVSEDIASIRFEKEVNGGASSNKQPTRCTVNPTSFAKHNGDEHSRIPEASERSSLHHRNQDWFASGLRDPPIEPLDFCPRFFRMPLDGYYHSPNIKVIRNSSSNSKCRRPGPVSPPLRIEEYLKTYNEPPVAQLFNKEKRKHTLSESTAMNNAHSVQFQSFPHLSPNELMNTFLSDSSQAGITCGRRNINEEFVGLPLNSQGELITMNSSNKRDVNQTTSSPASAANSISLSLPRNAVSNCHHSEFGALGCRTPSMNQLDLFPVDSYVKENPVSVIPSRNTSFDMDFFEINYQSFHDTENIMWKGHNQAHNCPDSEKIQSTMRLMGKEFTVDSSGIQGFEDGHIWKDKQIIDEVHFGNNSTSNVVHDQSEPLTEKFRETLFFPSEITINHRSESKYALPQFDHQPSSMYPSVFVARKIDPLQKKYPCHSPATFSEVYSNESFSESFTGGYESGLFTLEPVQQEVRPNVIPKAMQLGNNHSLHHSQVSSIRFPFLHPDLDGPVLPSWSQRSLQQPPLCCDVSEKETLLSSSLGHNHPYLNPGSSHHGMDHSSATIEPDDFRIFFPLSSVSSSQTSVAPPSLASMPYYPGIFMQKRHGTFKERMKSRIGSSRGLDHGKKALSTVPFKMPSLGSCPATNKPRFVMCGEERTISPWVETAKTGTVKLIGGGKHVLKACKQKDQSSSSSTDQELSLSATNMDFRFPESDNPAKIFGFPGKAPVFEL